MLFSSNTFLCAFLPLTLITYYLVPSRLRNYVALAASLLFYAWGAPQFIFALTASSWVDYRASQFLRGPIRARRDHWILYGAVTINLVTLLYFKYMNFFVDQLNIVLQAGGGSAVTWASVVMPIGISFFTFQKISYLIDVHRQDAEPADCFSNYLLYVILFPQLIAGPIVRYQDVARQLVSRQYSEAQFILGAKRFAAGLAQKIILADNLAVVVDAAFGATADTLIDPHRLTCGAAWGAALCYSMQLYFDFKGYSDMAIGLGHMLGIRFLENFDDPYISRSIGEFWRRWHISLSTFMREYLYIPLGGSRVPAWHMYLNVLIVFVLSGFWHGASWNFIAWGAVHGTCFASERYWSDRRGRANRSLWGVPQTFLIVLLAWVLFRAWDLPQAVTYLSVMLFGAQQAQAAPILLEQILMPHTRILLCIALAISFLPIIRPITFRRPTSSTEHVELPLARLVRHTFEATLLLLIGFIGLVSSGFHPFIYFRF